MEDELKRERKHEELNLKIRELERVKKELNEKDLKNKNLRQAVDKLNERMQSYEIKSSDTTEDKKMLKIKDDMIKREHEDEVKRLQEKIRLLEKSRNQRSEELK